MFPVFDDAQWGLYTDMEPFKPNDWVISLKTIKDLNESPFSGDIMKYRDWPDLM